MLRLHISPLVAEFQEANRGIVEVRSHGRLINNPSNYPVPVFVPVMLNLQLHDLKDNGCKGLRMFLLHLEEARFHECLKIQNKITC